jgi:hypothetical protein
MLAAVPHVIKVSCRWGADVAPPFLHATSLVVQNRHTCEPAFFVTGRNRRLSWLLIAPYRRLGRHCACIITGQQARYEGTCCHGMGHCRPPPTIMARNTKQQSGGAWHQHGIADVTASCGHRLLKPRSQTHEPWITHLDNLCQSPNLVVLAQLEQPPACSHVQS